MKPFGKQLITFYKMVINKFLLKVTCLKSIRSSYNMVKDLMVLFSLFKKVYWSAGKADLR